MTRPNRRRDLLRRYPSLAFVALSVALAATLPSALNLPTSGPTELAELAPVPPEDDVPPQQGDVSALGEAGSEGLGAGPGSGVAPPPPPPPPAGPAEGPDQGNPQHKRCVGDPPRQTEDPLSPPCVSYFDGDNGGATARGVTGDEVVIVAVFASGSRAGQWIDYGQPATDDDGDSDRRLRVYVHYFNDRYQTWGRQVRVFGYPVQNQMTAEQARAHAAAIDEGPPGAGRPFGVFLATNHQVNGQRLLVADTARRGMLSVAYDGDDRADHVAAGRLYLSVQPDLEDIAASMADHVCSRLAGRAPSYAGGTTATAAARRFGLYVSQDEEDPEFPRLADLFLRQVDATPDCVFDLADQREVSDNTEHSTHLASMRAQGVTTIVPFLRYNYRGQFTHVIGSQAGWEPEIFVPGLSGFLDDAALATSYSQAAWQHAFGVTYDRRRGQEPQQPSAVAHRDACPSCSHRGSLIDARTYETMALMFRAIQAAGPELTPERAEQGLRSIPPHRAPSPDAPAAYFTPGNFSFFKDGMHVWWDPTGVPPGRDTPDGCFRLVEGGTRYRAGDWGTATGTPFDRAAEHPCQGWVSPGAGR